MIFLDQQRCCCLNSIVCVMFSLSGVEERVGEFVCYFSPGLVLIFPRVRFFSWAWPGVLEHPPARGWQGRILWEKVAAHPPGGPIVQHTILIPQYVIPRHTTRRHTTRRHTTPRHPHHTTNPIAGFGNLREMQHQPPTLADGGWANKDVTCRFSFKKHTKVPFNWIWFNDSQRDAPGASRSRFRFLSNTRRCDSGCWTAARLGSPLTVADKSRTRSVGIATVAKSRKKRAKKEEAKVW